jgi:hypothetical protein
MSPLCTPRKRTAEDSRMEWTVTSKTDDTLQRGTLIGYLLARSAAEPACRRSNARSGEFRITPCQPAPTGEHA